MNFITAIRKLISNNDQLMNENVTFSIHSNYEKGLQLVERKEFEQNNTQRETHNQLFLFSKTRIPSSFI